MLTRDTARQLFDPKTFLIPTLAVLGILVLITFAYFGSERAAARQAQSFNVKNLLRKSEMYMLEAELAYRKYLRQPSELHKTTFGEAVKGYGESLSALHAVLDDVDPVQRAYLNTVDSLVRLELSEVHTSEARAVIDTMIEHENDEISQAPSLQLRYRLLVVALLVVSVIVLLRSLYVIYRRVAPVFAELEQTREELARSNDNTMESLARYKKLSAERAQELEAQEQLLSQRDAALAQLAIKTESLDRVTHAVAHELQEDLTQLERQLTEFIDLNSADTSLHEVQLSMQLRQTIADMRSQVDELDA